MEDRRLAIIPARGGSKGIPSKNIVKLDNIPLIAYSIQAALRSQKISRVVVSTDSDEISAVASKFGAEVVKRPTELTQDHSPIVDVIVHCLDVLELKENYHPDPIVLLQPTSPLRTHHHIDAAFRLLEKRTCDAVISVCESGYHPLKSFKLDEKGFLTGLVNNELCFTPRQMLPRALVANGAIYLIKATIFKKLKTLLPPKTLPYIMSKTESIDVDDIDDLAYISFLMSKYKTGNQTIGRT